MPINIRTLFILSLFLDIVKYNLYVVNIVFSESHSLQQKNIFS